MLLVDLPVSPFATQGSITRDSLQPWVAKSALPLATVCGMEWSGYWKEVAAPKARARKDRLGRAVSNTSIAAAVEASTGKRTSRQLVEAWFAGKREPYISQFFALCKYLELDPGEMLEVASTPQRHGMLRGALVHRFKIRPLVKDLWNQPGTVDVLRPEVGKHARLQGKRGKRRSRRSP
jgi:hypothetical protein